MTTPTTPSGHLEAGEHRIWWERFGRRGGEASFELDASA